jgi:hypothetical protein
MVRYRTSLKRALTDTSGVTLIELAIATAVMVLLMTLMMVVFRHCVDMYSATGLEGHLRDGVRAAVETVTSDVREAVAFNPVVPGQFLVNVFEPTAGEYVAGNDTNRNGVWDAGEAYDDVNADGLYDGPQDILLLTSARARVEEPFTDSNDNGVYDTGEPYTDLDGDGYWTDPNSNGRYDPPFRTLCSPVHLAGEPDPHSLIIYAIRQTPEGIRQLVKYTVYRVEQDINGDGRFQNKDNNGDGSYEELEDWAEGTTDPWNPPYAVVAGTSTIVTLQDGTGNPLVITVANGNINGTAPRRAPVVVTNDANSFQVATSVSPGNMVLAQIEVGLRRNVASFNANARQKGRVFASLTTSAYMMN